MAITLSNDILDHLFQTSPTFEALLSLILVCKTWHGVFQARRKSILRAVLNTFVIALPEALACLRLDSSNADHDQPRNLDVDSLSCEQWKTLLDNADVVRKLEVAFSSRHKNPFSKSSQLSPLESSRFAETMYRIILYCDEFRMPPHEDVIHELQMHAAANIKAQRYTFLKRYSTDELRALAAGLVFLKEEAFSAVRKAGFFNDEEDEARGRNDTLISTGPAVIASRDGGYIVQKLGYTLWLGETQPFALLTEYFEAPLRRIWVDRGVDAPPRSAHVHLWLSTEKCNDNWDAPDDCWYGFDCEE
ncbi:hypothetical protein C8F01DRAFT_1373451 [Mycena amicta]|nr:hypothetical protein C8F01DRAFT_1373451 [Mycena amicta]